MKKFLWKRKFIILAAAVILFFFSVMFQQLADYIPVIKQTEYIRLNIQTIPTNHEYETSEYPYPASELYSNGLITMAEGKNGELYIFGNPKPIVKSMDNTGKNIVFVTTGFEEYSGKTEITKDDMTYHIKTIKNTEMDYILRIFKSSVIPEKLKDIMLYNPAATQVQNIAEKQNLNVFDLISESTADMSAGADLLDKLNQSTGGEPFTFKKRIYTSDSVFIRLYIIPLMTAVYITTLISLFFVTKQTVLDICQEFGLKMIYGAEKKQLYLYSLAFFLVIIIIQIPPAFLMMPEVKPIFLLPSLVFALTGFVSLSALIHQMNAYLAATRN